MLLDEGHSSYDVLDDLFFEYLYSHSGAQQILPKQHNAPPKPERWQQLQQL